MKIGIHTITWYMHGWDYYLKDAAEIGYHGIELFHSPKKIPGGAQEVYDKLKSHNLSLAGICGGSLDERFEFVRNYCRLLFCKLDAPAAPYVYIDEWRVGSDRFLPFLKEGFKLGLHPHMYKPLQNGNELKTIFENYPVSKFPNLKFIPDTAHLTIAGDDVIQLIRDLFSRIDAIHLKDWNEDVGRSLPFYARGFCELGSGSGAVPLKNTAAINSRDNSIFGSLFRRNYQGWLIVELDQTKVPQEVLKRSYDFIREKFPPGKFVKT